MRTYRVSWTEHYEVDVEAKNEEIAIERALDKVASRPPDVAKSFHVVDQTPCYRCNPGYGGYRLDDKTEGLCEDCIEHSQPQGDKEND